MSAMAEPLVIIAGDTVYWERSAPTLPDASGTVAKASDGYTLTYEIRGNTGDTIADVSASANGDDFAVTIAKATTADWVAGWYYWQAYVADSGATVRYTVDSGRWEVKTNLAAATDGTYDGRTHVKKVLDAIEAVILGRASLDQMSYTIAGRQLSKTPIADLLLLRARYKAEYAAEQKAEAIARGEGHSGKILVRFTR